MKRPMCFISLCLVIILNLLLTIRPPDVYNTLSPLNEIFELNANVKDWYYKDNTFYLILSDAGILSGGFPDKKKYNVLVRLSEDLYDSIEDIPAIGQSVKVTGRQYVFERAGNPGQFDTAIYEKCRGIDFELTKARVLSVSGRADPLKEGLNRLRYRISGVYDRLFSKEYAGIIKAVTLGDKNSLDRHIKGLYQRAGAAHILVVSGLHISLIGIFLYGCLKKTRLPRPPSAIIAFIILYLYALMTGMGIPAKRALIMFAILLLSDCIGRSCDLLSSLAFSGCIILLGNPYCIYDAGFIMSFCAVIGAGMIKPAADRLFPQKGRIADSLKLSLSVTIFTFPVMLYFYFQVPVYSVFLNLVIVPLMGILLILALLCAFLGLFFIPAAAIPAFVCTLILKFYEGVCRINDKLPASILIKGRPHFVYIILYYLMLVLCVFLIEKYAEAIIRRLNTVKRLGIFLASAALILLVPVNINRGTEFTMLDIGQGDCSCILSSRGHVVMIDCGSSDEKEIASYKVIPFLKSRGKSKIDTLVVTHTDNDHISGITELLTLPEKDSLVIKRLIMPDPALKDEAYMELKELAQKRNVRVSLISSGDFFECDGIRFECLHPDRGYMCTDKNEYSTVLSADYGSFRALYTGDLQGKGEEILTKRIKKSYTLLKCAHHGSDNSTFEDFLQKVSPGVTFISAGRDNSYGHPGRELLGRLKRSGTKVFITMEGGALTLRTDGKSISVTAFKDL